MDGISNVYDNGWWAFLSNSPAWAVFDRTEKTKINSIVLMSGQKRHGPGLLWSLFNFKVTLKVDGQWINLTDLKVKEDPNAQIGDEGTIKLTRGGIQVLQLDFNTVSNVQSIRLDVMKTDVPNNNLVVNEIIPKFTQREGKFKTHPRRFSKKQTPIASISTKKNQQQTMIIRANVFRSKMKKKVKKLYCRPKQIFSD